MSYRFHPVGDCRLNTRVNDTGIKKGQKCGLLESKARKTSTLATKDEKICLLCFLVSLSALVPRNNKMFMLSLSLCVWYTEFYALRGSAAC